MELIDGVTDVHRFQAADLSLCRRSRNAQQEPENTHVRTRYILMSPS